MTLSQSPWRPENEAERLLCSLAGIISTRVVVSQVGRLDEIHILASPVFTAKQVVRNVVSALAAGMRILVDRRIISVAQFRRDVMASIPPGTPDDPTGEYDESGFATDDSSLAIQDRHCEPARGLADQRIVFSAWNARSQPDAGTECRVTVRHGGHEFCGTGAGVATSQGRAQAAARALFAALAQARGLDDLLLEDARLVESHGRHYVLVAAQIVLERDARPLTGVAPVAHSLEQAAILAALQATNRWTGCDG